MRTLLAIPWLAPLRDGIPTPANGSRRRPTVAPLRFAMGLTLVFGSATLGAPAARAEPPSRFEIPERVEVREAVRDTVRDTPTPGAPTHELVLLADVVARPGETPAEALSRALHGEEPIARR
jgi:hypothetical protein